MKSARLSKSAPAPPQAITCIEVRRTQTKGPAPGYFTVMVAVAVAAGLALLIAATWYVPGVAGAV